MATGLRLLSCTLSALLIFPSSSAAFDTPLSDTAVREAYFLGQRHDQSFSRFLDKYTKHLPPAKSGPYLSSISFLTPFALIAELSSQQGDDYSAQQAQLDHRKNGEFVRIVMELKFTDYSAWRPRGFWKDLQVHVFDGDKPITPLNWYARPIQICSSDGGCLTTGAQFIFEFSPESFASDTAVVQVTPPEGQELAVDFDLLKLR